MTDQDRIGRSGRAARIALTVSGSISLALGLVGVFLPVLPTTPFLLLSAFCYARSSPKLYQWLLSNRAFGRYIQDWQATRAIPLRTKIFALTTLSLSIGTSIFFFIPIMALKLIVGVIGFAVAIYIVKLPTRR